MDSRGDQNADIILLNGSSDAKVKRGSYGSVLPETWTSPLVVNEGQHEPSQRRLWLNVSLTNAGIFFLLMAMSPVSLLQSSLNSVHGLGVASMAVSNLTMAVASFFASSLIAKFGCKMVLVAGSLMYGSFIVANFYPSWFTLLPMAAVSGAGSTLRDVAHRVYLSRLAHFHSRQWGSDVDRMNSRFFVLFVVACSISSGLGNLASSLILSYHSAPEALASLVTCGAQYCNQPLEAQATTSILDAKICLFLGFCLVCWILSVVSFQLVDPLDKFGLSSTSVGRYNTSPKDLFGALKDIKQLLFIPLVVALQGVDTFFVADFNKAFISCSIGMRNVGFVWVWNAITGTVAPLLLGWFNTKTMRCFPVVVSTLLQMLVIMALFCWAPSAASWVSNYWALSSFAILFLFGSSVRNFITPVLVSVVFENDVERAFSLYYLWISLTSALFYTWSSLLCVSFKLYFLLAVSALSFISYVIMELIVERSNSPKS